MTSTRHLSVFVLVPVRARTTMAYFTPPTNLYGVRETERHSPAVDVVRVFALVVPDVKSPPVGFPAPSVARIETVAVPGEPVRNSLS